VAEHLGKRPREKPWRKRE